MMEDRCDVAGCGRRHGLTHLGGAFEGMTLCAFHRHAVDAGEGVPLRSGDTGYYDPHTGTYTVPPRPAPVRQGGMS